MELDGIFIRNSSSHSEPLAWNRIVNFFFFYKTPPSSDDLSAALRSVIVALNTTNQQLI